MKNIITLLLLFFGVLSIQAQEIRWMSIDEAMAKQKKVAKPIFLNVCTDWYGPCKMLDKETFQDPEFVDYINKNYYAVKFNAEGNSVINFKGNKYTNPGFDQGRKGRNSTHEFTKLLEVQGYPAMYIIDKNGEIQRSIVGYKTHDELLRILR